MNESAPVRLNADEIPWTERDASTSMAVLHGDTGKPGLYTMRIRARPTPSDGRPHWHPHDEFGTVLSGTVLVAAGERLDRAAAKALGPGAFIHIPPNVKHAVWWEGEAVLQIYAPGPRVTHFVEAGPESHAG